MTEYNLKQYRINTAEEMSQIISSADEDFDRYYNAMKKFLRSMRYGQKFDIITKVPEKNHKKFIQAACIYMVYGQDLDEVEFSDDYRFIVKKNKHYGKEIKKNLGGCFYR